MLRLDFPSQCYKAKSVMESPALVEVMIRCSSLAV